MKMLPMILLTLLLCAGLVSGKNIKSVKYTFDSKDTEYDDGTHELIIGELYADSHGTPLHKAHSLKTCEFCNNIQLGMHQDVLNYPIVIDDWNADNITGCLYINDVWKNQWIPLKVYETANESNVIFEDTIKLRSSLDGRCGSFPFGLDYTIKWGYESTTVYYNGTTYISNAAIKYSDPTNRFTDYLYLSDNDVAFSYMSFFLWINTSIPAQAIINSAMMRFKMNINAYDTSAEGVNFSAFYVYESWGETASTVTWNNRPTNSEFNLTGSPEYRIDGTDNPTAGALFSLNVTKNVQDSVNDNVDTLILWFNVTKHIGALHNNDYCYIYAPSAITTDYSPMLNVTYTELADTSKPYILNYPINYSTTNSSIAWNISLSESANLSGVYGKIPSYTDIGTFKNTTFASFFRFNFSGLTNNTAYGFNITQMCDSTGNCNQTGYNFSFITAQNPPVSSCPYTPIDCSVIPVISSGCDNQGNDIYIYGSGTLEIQSDIINTGSIIIGDGCNVVCNGGCFK